MNLSSLSAISPIDGRYHSQTQELSAYFSEKALMRYRVLVEVEYFISLCELPLPQLADFNPNGFSVLRKLYENFSDEDAQTIKDTEKITNHDVKAVEYFIKTKMEQNGMNQWKEFVHFGLTSQDINNTSVPLSIKNALHDVYFPALENIIDSITRFANEWKNIPMLARTHGQPASPTRLGKEFFVFAERLTTQLNQLKHIPHSAKFGGATGNLNAHVVSYPEHDWVKFANSFVNHNLGLYRSQTTTQIEHYDNLAALCDGLKRINTILIDLNRDMWTYISMDYFKQKIKAGEVGSSAMPHKVNPIDFENSEGNLGIANALLEHLAAKLPVSRLQRDLTDSTVMRNIGVPFSHILISFKSLQKGLGKIILNEQTLKNDLDKNWAVVAEAIQTILRRENYPNPYEKLKELTRTNSVIDEKAIKDFIQTLDVSEAIKEELRKISPYTYTGINFH